MKDEDSKTETFTVGHISGVFGNNVHEGELDVDTRVILGTELLCWISYEDRKNFLEELTNVVEKYRI